MPHSADDHTVDELFARYCASGRPRWLAAVFDQTAPELLRVAIHTVRDPHRAEDLVQACFVEAIRKARSYDRNRRVLPWLLGILANLAKEQHRRERRTPDADRVAVPNDDNPVEAASSGELDRAVDDAVQRLPEVYRPVLLLHLQHGLGPAEIAHALGRGAGTVRSQLARGLEQLRRALPAGFAGAIALGLVPTRGIAAVRSAVVTRARWAWPSIAAATSRSWLQSSRGIAVAALTIATVTALAVLNSDTDPAPATGEDADAPPITTTGDAPAAASSQSAQFAREPGAAPERYFAELRVRVVDDAGRAVANVGVRVFPAQGCDPLLHERRGRTDATGIATFARLPPAGYRIRTDRSSGPSVSLRGGASSTIEVPLGSGRDVRGRVVDREGQPVDGASIWLASGGRADNGMIATTSGRDGTFSIRSVTPGHHVAAFAPGFAPCRSQPIDEHEGERTLRLTQPAARVSGRVVASDGTPLANARVCFGHEGPPFRLVDVGSSALRTVTNTIPMSLHTDRFGRFSSASITPGADVQVFARADDHVGVRRSVSLRVDAPSQLEITLTPGGRFRGALRVGPSPARAAHVIAGAWQQGAPGWFQPCAKSDDNGEFELAGVADGPIQLQVFTESLGATVVDVEVPPNATSRVDIELDRAPHCRGYVRDESGRALAGVIVQWSNGSRRTATDANGSFRMLVPPDGDRSLSLFDPRCAIEAPLLRREGVPLNEPLELTVPESTLASATLTGSVRAADGSAPTEALVSFRDAGGRAWRSIAIDRDGTFSVSPITPGSYEVAIEAAGHPRLALGEIELTAGQTSALGQHNLAAGGAVHLRVRRAGELLTSRVNVKVQSPTGATIYGRDVVAAKHTIRWLPEGSWRISVWSSKAAIVTRTIEVRRGAPVALDVAIDGQRSQPFVVHGLATDQDLVPLRVRWFDGNDRELAADNYQLRTDDPRLTCPFLPGRYAIEATLADGRSARAPFVVRTGKAPCLPVHLRPK